MQASAPGSDQEDVIAITREGQDISDGTASCEEPSPEEARFLTQFLVELARSEFGLPYREMHSSDVESSSDIRKLYSRLCSTYNLNGSDEKRKFLERIVCQLYREYKFRVFLANGVVKMSKGGKTLHDAVERLRDSVDKLKHSVCEVSALDLLEVGENRKIWAEREIILDELGKCLDLAKEIGCFNKLRQQKERLDSGYKECKAIRNDLENCRNEKLGFVRRDLINRLCEIKGRNVYILTELDRAMFDLCGKVASELDSVLSVSEMNGDRVAEIFEFDKDFGKKLFPGLYSSISLRK
ncbi:MAG: hypothetical protein LW808_003510 [Verrucomicrobiota bacterium]|nr:MAG: hypothetical protein LW808_003510 [Verrucomicrobiota bacterium]